MAPPRKITKKPKRGPQRVIRRLKPRRKRAEPPGAPDAPPPERPRVYDRSTAEKLLDRMANGETPTEICRDPQMPAWHHLCRWRRQNDDFDKRFRIAWESCCEFLVCDVVTIADNATNDYMLRQTKHGAVRMFDREAFERSRLRVDSRKWMASKILRHVYGDKAEVDVRTPDGVNIKTEQRNALIDAIVKLVEPKVDGKTKPSGRTEEARER